MIMKSSSSLFIIYFSFIIYHRKEVMGDRSESFYGDDRWSPVQLATWAPPTGRQRRVHISSHREG